MNCRVCGYALSPFDKECPRCVYMAAHPPKPKGRPAPGVQTVAPQTFVSTRFPDGSRLAHSVRIPKTRTAADIQSTRSADDCLTGCGMFSCLFVPFGMLIAIPALLLRAFSGIEGAIPSKTVLEGNSPHCDGSIWIDGTRANCPLCGKLVIVLANRFYPPDARPTM